jgi:hypothetical protein
MVVQHGKISYRQLVVPRQPPAVAAEYKRGAESGGNTVGS